MSEHRHPNDEGKDDGERSELGIGRIVSVLFVVCGLAGLVYYLSTQFPGVISDPDQQPYLVYLLILGGVIGATVVMGRDFKWGKAVKAIAIWVAVGLALVIGYSYRDSFTGMTQRVAGELSPSTPVKTSEDSLSIRASADGHYYVNADVNGRAVRLLVDTGASVTVLSRADADRIGINLNNLDYTRRIRTANGVVRAASTEVRDLRIGPIELRDLPVLIIESPTRMSVLGLSTLRRFRGYDVRDNVLTLRW